MKVGLEKFGGSVSQVLSLFPAGYAFFAAVPDSPFAPLKEDSALLLDRFFLVAIAAKREDSQAHLVSNDGHAGEVR